MEDYLREQLEQGEHDVLANLAILKLYVSAVVASREREGVLMRDMIAGINSTPSCPTPRLSSTSSRKLWLRRCTAPTSTSACHCYVNPTCVGSRGRGLWSSGDC